MEEQRDLFGDVVIKDVLLREKFLEPPFSVLDTRSGHWQNRKRRWRAIGLRSELGRATGLTYNIAMNPADEFRRKESEEAERKAQENSTSIFDPALTELMYRWFCPESGTILDPFAGGSVRGIVANYLGFNYTGIDLRQEQIDSNREQALEILPVNSQPSYYVGDSNDVLDNQWNEPFDMVFSCPPYADLEVYSDDPLDLSTMDYPDFLTAYRSIIEKTVRLLKPNRYAVFVVGEARGKDGFYYDFVTDTKRAFRDAGARLYNDAILLNVAASAAVRAPQFARGKKLVKVHQNVLIFRKP